MHRFARATGVAAALVVLAGGFTVGSRAVAAGPAPKLAQQPISLPEPVAAVLPAEAPAPEAAPVPEPVALPTPAPPPEDERAIEPVVVLGTIEIPRLGLSVPLNQGVSLSTIDRGPSHWPGTALPGQTGNVVVAGHRVTNTRPFRHIDTLQIGDEIIFTVDGARSVYRVTHHDVVTPDAMHIVDQTAEPIATLFACHPPGSARYRYVVRAALVQPT